MYLCLYLYLYLYLWLYLYLYLYLHLYLYLYLYLLTRELSACRRTFLLTGGHICLHEGISAYMKAYLLKTRDQRSETRDQRLETRDQRREIRDQSNLLRFWESVFVSGACTFCCATQCKGRPSNPSIGSGPHSGSPEASANHAQKSGAHRDHLHVQS